MVYIGVGGMLFLLIVYLITKKELKDKATHFIAIAIFVLTCFYIFSIDFTFNSFSNYFKHSVQSIKKTR